MKRFAGMLVALSLVMLVGSPVGAEDKEKKAEVKKADAKKGDAKKGEAQKEKGPRKQPTLAEMTLKRFAEVELTETQQQQVKDIAAEFEPKILEAIKAAKASIPEEQVKALKEALAKAKAEGKKPAEVRTAFKLTPEQIAAQKQAREVQTAFNAKINEVLTEQQRETLKKNRPAPKGKKPDGEKKPGAEKKPAGDKKPAKKAE